ncbi:hypothetical protein BC832DRAFT_554661 [Gaertneriomyces semiglobifer]|nr:hypothetical protein BC832DRAFT_554661 [Gaertneriomyces semiglobifer]
MAREFENIYLGGSNKRKDVGRLKVAEAGIGWKNAASGKVTAVPAADIQKLSWLRCARDFELRVQNKDGNVIKFDGFPRDAYEPLAHLVKNLYHKTIEQKDLSVRGWNWGSVEFSGNNMTFNVANRPAFEVPLNKVANANLATRNEVSIEFIQPETPVDPKNRKESEDSLVELRLFVPGMGTEKQVTQNEEGVKLFKDKDDASALKTSQEVPNGENDETAAPVLDEDGEALSSAHLLCETIKQKADFGGTLGEAIASFANILCLTPRGRYEVDMFPDFFRLRGKSHDYKILYSSIVQLFLLPKPDELHYMFVVGLDPPLRQGQTRYPHLIFQFEREEEVELELNIEDALLESKYEGQLLKTYDGPVYEVVSEVIKGLSGKKVTSPGGTYKSSQGQSGIKCAYKANEAFLYPLERTVVSIPKPSISIQMAEIAAVTFSRVGGGGGNALKTFEIKFNLKDGPEYTYSSIPREEYETLEPFFRSRKVKVVNDMADATIGYHDNSDLESEEEDATASRKRIRTEVDGFDDEDESEDEDFAPDEDSDVAEEFDEQYAGSESEGEAAVTVQSDDEEGEKSKSRPKPVVSKSSKEPAKKKAKKDKDAPKRGMSAFLLFSSDKRKQVMEENPGITLPETGKKLGEMWKNITDDDRAVSCAHSSFSVGHVIPLTSVCQTRS